MGAVKAQILFCYGEAERSQVFANFYLTEFDHFMKHHLAIMQHYKMYNFKSKLIKHCCGIYWKNYFSFKTTLKKIVWLKN